MSQIFEQYLKAIEVFDEDNSRFWTRFNLFTGVQLIVVAGIAANFGNLAKHKLVGYLLITIAFAFSVFTILVMRRSYQIQMGLFKTILEFEEKDKSLVLLKTYMKHSRSPMGAIARYCVAMSILLSVFWVVLLLVFLAIKH